MKTGLIIVIILFIGYCPSWSQNSWLKEQAVKGDKIAQYKYAMSLLSDSFSSSKDKAEAISWMKKSAAKGYSPAQSQLGLYYLTGDGVEKDHSKAALLFEKAAKQGNVTACYYLGLCYAKGYGLSKSMLKAVEWYKSAADGGNAAAQNNLGSLYLTGNGVERNYALAVSLFEKAANQDDSCAQYNLALCYEHGYGLDKSLKDAFSWYVSAAENENPGAQYKLALYYLEGKGVEKDSILATELLLHSAGGGYLTPSQMYDYDPDKAYDKAMRKLKELCGNLHSEYNGYFIAMLGCLYHAKQDYETAEEFYKLAQRKGCCLGAIELGLMYFYILANSPLQSIPNSDTDENYICLEGCGLYNCSQAKNYYNKKIWKDTDNVEYWLKNAISNGYGNFEYGVVLYSIYDYLLFVYVDGIGVKRNLDKAIDVVYDCLMKNSGSSNYEHAFEALDIALKDPMVSKKAFKTLTRLSNDYKGENKNIYKGLTFRLGRCYYKGLGTGKDYNLAFKYLLESANKGNWEAMSLLAACYRYGRGTKVDKAKEKEWLEKVAQSRPDSDAKKILEKRSRYQWH